MKKTLRKTLLLIVTIIFIIGPTFRASADLGLLDIVGFAEKIGDWIIGVTTVTPSYELYTWDYQNVWKLPGFTWQAYSGHYDYLRLKFRRDVFTGQSFYYSSTHFPDGAGGSSISNTSPFMLGSVALQNYLCSKTNSFESTVQTYTIAATCSLVSTAALPPTGPFDVQFKTVGTKLPISCNDTNTGWSREFRKTFQVMPYGITTGRVGSPSFSFAYPFQCWVGTAYQY